METLTKAAYVGRQPIYSQVSQTVAYELLFRSSEENQADIVDGECATAELLLNVFAEIGLERVVGKLPAFINVSEEFILKGYCQALPQDKVVIEVLEDVRPTPEVLAALAELKKVGYKLALDDFVYSSELMPLVKLVNIVKVDLPQLADCELAEHVNLLRRYDVKLLAEKVETVDDFEACKSLGFDFYQGYFFCRPTVVKGRRVPSNRLTVMRLISKLQKPAITLNEISEIIQTEPTLAYKLLRFVNSSQCGLNHKIESIKHAVVLVGIHHVKTLCSLTMLAEAAMGKPGELVKTLLVRAKMAELLAIQLKQAKTDSFFLVGLFSAIDALLDLPMDQALDRVPVSNDVHEALLNGHGTLGMVLNCVLEYENGRWDTVVCSLLDANRIKNCYLTAIEWADESLSSLL